jgi:hypothetical protein
VIQPETPLQAALTYAARGWAVFPCHTIGPGGCSCHQPDCNSPGKHPTVARGLHAATIDRADVRTWWQRRPGNNVAIRTGGESGLVVVDVDPDHGGIDSLRALVDTHGRLPAGPRVRTGSGGWHLYFQHPGELIRNSAGTRLGVGVDIRADGGYVIAPPSQHRSLHSYQWRDFDLALPDLPEWTLDRLTPPSATPTLVHRHHAQAPPSDAWARSALTGEADSVRAAPEGTRNHALNRAAFCLGQIVAVGALDPGTVEAALLKSALQAGLGEREALRTLQSGLTAGIANPRLPTGGRTSQPAHQAPAVPEASHELGLG